MKNNFRFLPFLSMGTTAAFVLLFLLFMKNRGMRLAVAALLVVCTMICLATCLLTWLYIRSAAKSIIESTQKNSCRMLRHYMEAEEDCSEIFPPEYAETAALAVEIKERTQKRERKQREESDQRNELITYLAHDLRTPLTSVIGYLCLLREIPDLPAEQKSKYLEITLAKARRLENLINEFFDITRYHLHQIQLQLEEIDLSYMLVQVTDEFFPLLTSHGNKVILKTPEKLMICADPARLARVFYNILKNAISYSYPNTDILVYAAEESEHITIRFENEGKTIPPSKLPTIFDKFCRLDQARNSDMGGAGLGLAIAKEIIMLHNGAITAESKDERVILTIFLPAQSCKRAASGKEQKDEMAGRPSA